MVALMFVPEIAASAPLTRMPASAEEYAKRKLSTYIFEVERLTPKLV